MKKIILMCCSIAFVFSLAACEKSDEQKQKEQPQKGSMGGPSTGKHW